MAFLARSALLFPKLVVTVYDRWGQEVYISEEGYPVPWNGTNKFGAELPFDSYYYIIDMGIGSKLIGGSITIIK